MKIAQYIQQEKHIAGPDDFSDDLFADLLVLEQQIREAPAAPSFNPAVRPGYLYAIQLRSNTEIAQPALLRHGGYGATRRDRTRHCAACGWSLHAEIQETRPDG